MSIEIDFSYQIDGFYDSVNYYRSETPMNPESMPVATATGITGLTYTDTTATRGKFYYVRFGSVRSGVEKISEEKQVFARNLSAYTAFFLNKLTANDWKGGAALTPTGNAAITAGGAYFDGAGDYYSRPDSTSTTFGTGDLTIEFIFKCERIGTHTYEQALVDNFIISSGGWQIGLRTDGRVYVYMNTPNGYVMNSTASFSDGNEHHVAWTRNGSTNRLFVDGVQVATYTDSRNFTAKTYFGIGAQINSRQSNYDFKGWIRKVGVSKQALYTSNFTPDMN